MSANPQKRHGVGVPYRGKKVNSFADRLLAVVVNGTGSVCVPPINRLLVGISAGAVPDTLVCTAILRELPHRLAVGLVVDVRLSPLSSPWADFARRHGLDLRTYAPAGDECCSQLNDTEILLGISRRLADPKVDGVLIVGLSVATGPIARIVHDSGRPLVLGVRTPLVERALRVADAVVDIDKLAAKTEAVQ